MEPGQGGLRPEEAIMMARAGRQMRICTLHFLIALFLAQLLSGQSVSAEAGGIVLTPMATGLSKPTSMTHAGDNSGRLFVTEQEGRIIVLRGADSRKETFLDISDRVSCCGERGLLSVAFPPDFDRKRYFYVDYTDRNGDTRVSRFRLAESAGRADPASEELILFAKQPFANHNGGQLSFGPDGYLYIAMGDGGSAGDPFGNGQRTDTLLGKILRIDTESKARPYAVPPSNPFVARKGHLPEIWSLGLRNPWRFAFDRKTGDLYIADVGQNKYEEVNVQPRSSRGGENYGWNILEGTHCFRSKNCDRTGLTMPVAEYEHSRGCSITGGRVYRGREFPALDGVYLYGDYCSGRIWGLRRAGNTWEVRELLKAPIAISTFGEDEQGSLYVADYDDGRIYKIEAGRQESGR